MKQDFKVKIKGPAHRHKLPFFCPHCERITGTIDDACLVQLGICSVCFVMHVDERKIPVIDLSEYAPPGGVFEDMTCDEINSCFLNDEK